MKPVKSSDRVEARSPMRAGAGPHFRTPRALTTCALALALAAAAFPACANNDANVVQPPVVLGMTQNLTPYYQDEQTTIYQVTSRVPLPVRKPTDAESAALGGNTPPYPHAPFLLASDLRIEVRFTLSNVDDAPHVAELLLDPWNEFVRWEPGVTVVNDEETVPNRGGFDKLYQLGPKERLEGTITTDDTHELGVDLATAMAILANPPADDASVGTGALLNHVFDIQNRSNSGDPLLGNYVPAVIAGITGFDLSLRTYEKANVAVEIVVDVTDENGKRLLPQGSTDAPIGRPGKAIMPPGARQGN
jgi:hypothetical protein